MPPAVVSRRRPKNNRVHVEMESEKLRHVTMGIVGLGLSSGPMPVGQAVAVIALVFAVFCFVIGAMVHIHKKTYRSLRERSAFERVRRADFETDALIWPNFYPTQGPCRISVFSDCLFIVIQERMRPRREIIVQRADIVSMELVRFPFPGIKLILEQPDVFTLRIFARSNTKILWQFLVVWLGVLEKHG